MTISKNRNN